MDYTTLQTPSQWLEKVPQSEAPSLYQALKSVTDGRKRRGVRYDVALILTLLLLGKLAGCKSVAAVAHWVSLRTDPLLDLLPTTRKRFPCQATYGNVLKVLDAEGVTHALAGYFERRAHEPRGAQEAQPDPGPAHVALDGKTLRGTRKPASEQPQPVHLLSLYDVKSGIVLAQREVGEKRNEISEVEGWLTPALVKGRLVSADAIHTQRRYCADIVRFGGDYLLIAKKNQPTLWHDLHTFFTDPQADAGEWQEDSTWNKGHGRREHRRIRTTTLLNPLFAREWAEIGQAFQLRRRVIHPLKCTQQIVYGITSLTPAQARPAHLLKLLRTHWHIENRLHWRRDVTLGEDLSQLRTGEAPAVLAALNNAVLALMDALHVARVPVQMRIFDAHPQQAVELLLTPPRL